MATNERNLLTREEFMVVDMCNEDSGGKLRKVLNDNGCARWTVCPECRVDDFVHVEGCSILEEING